MSEVALPPAAGLARLVVGVPLAGSRACRSLFGPVDREGLRQELQGRLCELAEEARERWGFDFQTGAPVPGARLRWEPVEASALPAFYREKETRAGAGPARECPAGNTSEITAGQGLICPEAAATEQGEEEAPIVTARITDFFPKRKRGAPSKGACEGLLPSGCTVPAELTPRKRLR